MAFAVILICVLAVVAGLLLVPVRLDFRYRRDMHTGNTAAYLRIGWFRFDLTKQKPDKQKKTEKPKEEKGFSFSEFQEKFRHYTELFNTHKDNIGEIISYAAHHAVKIDNIEFKLDYGFEDPMYTGIAMGIISGAAYNILAFLTQQLTVSEHKIDIRPDFDMPCFRTRFWCIVRLQNVHIMVIAVKALRLFWKIQKTEKAQKNTDKAERK